MGKTIAEWQDTVHANAMKKGFWDGVDPLSLHDIALRTALLHTEVTEAFEEVRSGQDPRAVYYEGGSSLHKPEGLPIELADVVIRVMDWCGGLDINLEEMIKLKHAYNVTRPHMHGKQC